MGKFIENGKMTNPLAGIEHYDLNRLSGDQLLQLNDIVNKSRSGQMLSNHQIKQVMTIRKAAATSCAPTGREPASNAQSENVRRLSGLVAEMKRALE